MVRAVETSSRYGRQPTGVLPALAKLHSTQTVVCRARAEYRRGAGAAGVRVGRCHAQGGGVRDAFEDTGGEWGRVAVAPPPRDEEAREQEGSKGVMIEDPLAVSRGSEGASVHRR